MAVTASARRLTGGFNLLASVALIILLAVLLVWAAKRYGGRVDVTRSGVNSLSPRTAQLLQGVGQELTLTGVYTTALEEVRPHAAKHAQRVWDLLDMYDAAGGAKVTTFKIDPKDNPKAVTELLARIKQKPEFVTQAEPYETALAEFNQLNQDIAALVQQDAGTLTALSQQDPALAGLPELATIERNSQALASEAKRGEKELQTLREDEVPRYSSAKDVIVEYLGQVRSVLESHKDWMTRTAEQSRELATATRGFFSGAGDRYASILERVTALQTRLDALKPLDLETVYESLRIGQTVIVESGDKIAAVSHEDIWPFRTNSDVPPPQDGDPREFAGEQALSSAILKLTQKDRTAVVFVRFGGIPLLTPDFTRMNPMQPQPQAPPFEQLGKILEHENFMVREWDLQTAPAPPPAEGAARTVYVVFPPPPQQRPNFMQPEAPQSLNPQQKALLLEAIDQAQRAIFLTGWGGMQATTPYPYADYLKDNWGITAEPQYLAMRFMPNPDKTDRYIPADRNMTVFSSPAVEVTEHPIAAPLRSLPIGLQMAAPLAVAAADALPAGVSVTPILRARASDDVWAFQDVMRIQQDFQTEQGTRRYEDDLAAPFPLAVAAEREGRRLVVFGSEQFASDNVLNMGSLMQSGGSLVVAQLYPGNRDLFINTLHWLTGDANRIAVGPDRGDVPRLSRLEDGPMLQFVRIFLVGLWPGVALLCGAVVWFLRRR